MEINYKNILITGGCGFIASNFIRYLYHAYPEYHIFNLDLLTYAGNLENLADIEKVEEQLMPEKRRYHFIKGDICDNSLLVNLFTKYKFDLIVHFAAETHVDRSIFNVSDFIRTNIEGTRSLMEMACKYNRPRFIYISTDEVYGSIAEGFFREDAPLRPSNPYSASKAGADLLVQVYMKTYKLSAIIVRGSNNFGLYQYPEKLIPLAITNIIEGKKIPVHGSGMHVRSWIHVSDFCNALDLIMHKGRDSNIYNLSGDSKTNFDVLELIAKSFQKNINTLTERVNDRPSADPRYAPDSTKARQELGWSPRHTVESSIGEVIKWYAENQQWWLKVKQKKEYVDHYEKQSKGLWY